MIVPMRVLMKVMRSLLKRSQRLSLRFQRKKAAVMKKKIVKRKVTNRLKLPTQNRHRKKPKLLPKTIVSLLDRRRFLLGIYPTV